MELFVTGCIIVVFCSQPYILTKNWAGLSCRVQLSFHHNEYTEGGCIHSTISIQPHYRNCYQIHININMVMNSSCIIHLRNTNIISLQISNMWCIIARDIHSYKSSFMTVFSGWLAVTMCMCLTMSHWVIRIPVSSRIELGESITYLYYLLIGLEIESRI